MNAVDEHAVEAALQLRESAGGGEVVVVTIAPESSSEFVRPALAMGADRAIVVSGSELVGSDLLGTSRALAAAMGGVVPDLLIFGAWSADGNGGMLWAAVAERLSLPVVSRAIDYQLDGTTLTVTRQLEQGLDVVAVDLPAVLALSGEVTTPRYPSFKEVIASKKKPVEVFSPTADLGIPADALGSAGARTTVLAQVPAPRRHGGVIVADDGHAHERLLEFLVSRGLV